MTSLHLSLTLPKTYTIVIESNDTTFERNYDAYDAPRELDVCSRVPPKYKFAYWWYLFREYISSQCIFFSNDLELPRRVIKTNLHYLHIGDDAPWEYFSYIFPKLQTELGVIYKVKLLSCGAQATQAPSSCVCEPIFLQSCDGTQNLSQSNFRCWKNLLKIKCDTVDLITYNIVDTDITDLCVFILLTLGDDGVAIIQLPLELTDNENGFISFMCSKFEECKLMRVINRIYLYCGQYKRYTKTLSVVQKLLNGRYKCAKNAAFESVFGAMKADIGAQTADIGTQTADIEEFMAEFTKLYPHDI